MTDARDLSPANPEQVGLSAEGLARVDAAVQEQIDKGVLAGAVTLVARHGRIVHTHAMGQSHIETGEAMRENALFRIFSMTKPVTAAAMMVLHDQGLWSPDDPIARHLPEFAEVKVLTSLDADGAPLVEAPSSPPTLRQLMTHTAGLAYGMQGGGPVDALYLQNKVWRGGNLAELSRRVAATPLAYHPGTRWSYSIAMDIQGALIERLTGQSLPDFMQEKLFGPLGMTDTAFFTPPAKKDRLAGLYLGQPGAPLTKIANPLMRDQDEVPALASGGGGLISTAGDYARFAQMLLNKGEFGGQRILSPQAVALMMTNQLPDRMLQQGFSVGQQRLRPGFGFGFNGVVFTDPALAGVPVGKGTYHWDGAAGTWFWVDPENDLLFVGLIQLMSANAPPLQATTQTLMAAAIVGP